MTNNDTSETKQRNRNYEETHSMLIERAAELISGSGADGVSLLVLARVTGINRSTIYYHFATREELMAAAQNWLLEKSIEAGETNTSRWVGKDEIAAMFQRNPDVITSWIDDYLAVADVRERYPQWDRLVAQIGHTFAELAPDRPCDAEVYWALMLSSASAVPGTVTDVAHPFESLERFLEKIAARAACLTETGAHDEETDRSARPN